MQSMVIIVILYMGAINKNKSKKKIKLYSNIKSLKLNLYFWFGKLIIEKQVESFTEIKIV